MNKKIASEIAIGIIFLVAIALGAMFYLGWKKEYGHESGVQINSPVIENPVFPVDGLGNQVACPMDAKQCPDGSYVSRVAPNCEFAQCPEGVGARERVYLSHHGGEKSGIYIDCVKNEDCKLVDLDRGCDDFSSINKNNTYKEISKFRVKERELTKDIIYDCYYLDAINNETAISICEQGQCSYVKKNKED